MTAPREPVPQILALDDPEWCSFVAHSPAATPFHHPAWAEVLSATYGYRPFAIVVANEAGRVVAGAPFVEVRSPGRRRRWISLPFTDECPPLAADAASRDEFTAALALAHTRLHAPAVHVRGLLDGFSWRTEADAVIHELELDADPANVRARFSRSQVNRNIARAEREGVIVRRATELRDLDAFYALHVRTRRRQGVPVQPRRFFDLLWSRLVEPGLASILLADAGRRTSVAGALFLASGGCTIYKFGASDVDGWPLRPNHLIFWTAIQEACARSDSRFDFGRSDLDNGGLRAFKSSWGATERPLRYSMLAPDDGRVGLAARALKATIRRGPSWVCRGAGEAFYRYAAFR